MKTDADAGNNCAKSRAIWRSYIVPAVFLLVTGCAIGPQWKYVGGFGPFDDVIRKQTGKGTVSERSTKFSQLKKAGSSNPRLETRAFFDARYVENSVNEIYGSRPSAYLATDIMAAGGSCETILPNNLECKFIGWTNVYMPDGFDRTLDSCTEHSFTFVVSGIIAIEKINVIAQYTELQGDACSG